MHRFQLIRYVCVGLLFGIASNLHAFQTDQNKTQLPEQVSSSSITAQLWHDRNGNGRQDTGEPGIEGVNALLFDSHDHFLGIAVSDAIGNCLFENLPAGSYRIKFPKVQGLQFTVMNATADTQDSDADTNGYSPYFTLGSSQDISHVDAGYKGSLEVYLGNTIVACKGQEVELNASVFYGKAPYSFSWSHGLGSDPVQTFTPDITSIYSVTVTDSWGTTNSDIIIVRVKNGLGEEQCEIIDDFQSGQSDALIMEVTPMDPGPKTIVENAQIGLLGDTREVVFQYISGTQPAHVNVDYVSGIFANSNDVGTVSQTRICYDNHGQGLDFNLGAFDYLKISDIEVDQGGILLKVTIIDENGQMVVIDRRLPGLGASTVFDNEIPLETIPNIQYLDLEHIQEVCFDFYTSTPSVDYQMKSIAACRTTDCELIMDPGPEICLGESAQIGGLVPCAEQIIYQWDHNLGKGTHHTVSPSLSTEYHVTATDISGCTSQGSIGVVVNPVPSITLGPDLEICEGAPFTITATASGGTPPYTYAWNDDNGDDNDRTGTATSSTVYAVTVTDAKGCSAFAQMTLTVNENPAVELSTTLSGCGEDNGTATAVATGGLPPYEYFWSNGNNGPILTGLAPAIYLVTVVDANGCFATGEITVMEEYCGTIGDRVWLDTDGDGKQEAGEPGMEGLAVYLFDGNYNPLDTNYTGANGYYAFNQLPPGTYHVGFTKPGDFFFSLPNQTLDSLDSDADMLSGFTPQIELDSMEQDMTVDAGMYQKASLGNWVWLDTNGNGIQDPAETGIPGVQVYLANCAQSIFRQTTTDDQGYYLFDGLTPANYRVRFSAPVGHVFSPAGAGSDPALDSDAHALTGWSDCLSLSSGENNDQLDAALYVPASIGDFVWHDLNANGWQDTAEPGLPGIQLILLDCQQNPIDTVITGSNGQYLFSNLPPGEYRIQFTIPADYQISPVNVGEAESDSDIDPVTAQSPCLTLSSGDNRTDIDGGLYVLSRLGNWVWEDYDLDGIQDPTEDGINGIQVDLLDCQENLLESQLTNADGYYLFENLVPATYRLRFNPNGNWSFTLADQGMNQQEDSDADPATGLSPCEILTSNETNLSFDAGMHRPGAIGDLVWEDLNANGIQDTGEAGMPGIKVVLTDCQGNRLDSTYTDPDGNYLFDPVPAAHYRLDFSDNTDAYFTLPYQGNDDEKDSDVIPGDGLTSCFLLASHETDLSLDAGMVYAGAVGDLVWEDLNGNGQQDPGEPGIAQCSVSLYREENDQFTLFAQLITDGNGGYLFENVPPGIYYVHYDFDNDFEATFGNIGDDSSDSDITHAHGHNTTADFLVSPGMIRTDIDAGIFQCAFIGDLIWCDYTKNAYWDPSENGINGLEVRLYRQNVNLEWEFWDQTTSGWKFGSTCGDGYWEFCTSPGNYYIELNIPVAANLMSVIPNQGSNEEYDSDITDANGPETTDVFTLLSQQVKTDFGAGYYYGGILADTVWLDTNHNGIQNAGESGMNQVKVELFDNTGKLAETYTNALGYYKFNRLEAGSYYLKFNAPAGYTFTIPNAGTNDFKDSDVTGANGSGTTAWINLAIEQKIYHIDAGLIPEASGLMNWNNLGGSYQGDHNDIWWSGDTDREMDFFELERKIPGQKEWNLLATLNPSLVITPEGEYLTKDFDIGPSGTYFYRIRMHDLTGDQYLSESIDIEVPDPGWQMYPVPTEGKLTIGFFNRDEVSLDVQIHSVAGIPVEEIRDIPLQVQSYITHTLDLQRLSPGTYQIRLIGAKRYYSGLFSIVR